MSKAPRHQGPQLRLCCGLLTSFPTQKGSARSQRKTLVVCSPRCRYPHICVGGRTNRPCEPPNVTKRKRLFREHLIRFVPLTAHIRHVLDEREEHRAPRGRFEFKPLAHHYALSLDIDTLVLGVKNRQELAECVAAADDGRLAPELMARVDEAVPRDERT